MGEREGEGERGDECVNVCASGPHRTMDGHRHQDPCAWPIFPSLPGQVLGWSSGVCSVLTCLPAPRGVERSEPHSRGGGDGLPRGKATFAALACTAPLGLGQGALGSVSPTGRLLPRGAKASPSPLRKPWRKSQPVSHLCPPFTVLTGLAGFMFSFSL